MNDQLPAESPHQHAAPQSQELTVSPRPRVDAEAAERLAADLFALTGAIKELGSNQDRNFLIRPQGRPEKTGVLRIANRGSGFDAIDCQVQGLRHIAATEPAFRSPVPVPGVDGELLQRAQDGEDQLPVYLLSFVEGIVPSGEGYLAPVTVADLGRLAGLCSAALAGFEHPGLDRVSQWDLRQAGAVLTSLLPSLPRPDDRELLERTAQAAQGRVSGLVDRLRTQAIHGDVTDDNVVCHLDEAGRLRPDGVIDFGDLGRSWLVADLAVTLTGLLRHSPDEPWLVLPAVRAFHEVVPLDEADVEALWPLVVLRGAVLVASGEHQTRLDPDNTSAVEALVTEWSIFNAARSVPFELAEAVIRADLGMADSPRLTAARAAYATAGSILPRDAPSVVVADLSVTSESLHSGRFLDPEAELAVLREAASETGAAATRFGEARLTRTVLDAETAPATYALAVDAVLPAGTEILAPWAGVVSPGDGGTLRLDGAPGRFVVGPLHPRAPSGEVSAGTVLGVVGESPFTVQVCSGADLDDDLDVPKFVGPQAVSGWLRLCPDPSALFGVDLGAPNADASHVLDRRVGALANVQEYYYEAPMRIERGWRQYLFDTDARAYLDMVNNVAAIGHAHPRLADAVERQLRTFNSNSRFHYEAIAEFSARLADLAPDGLDTVFLVNSGSEAVELALRMAQAATGRQDLIAVREAYHGWTALADAVTTSVYDNPKALETRPDWVHLASAPNTFRGTFRGPDSAPQYVAEMRELIADMVAAGRPPAAFIGEPVFGNAGGLLLPEGYLSGVYDEVRAAGGLCIADEVQVGYGRLGHAWWAYELQGGSVVPDVITIAKAMGNGHPLGAVITRREIADAFGAQGPFFSSAGGSPVSCVTGMTVLDVIRDESLQQNAAHLGDLLHRKCSALMDRFPIVGAVHGMGFYLGVELVRDRQSLEPATAECYAICDRLRELGIVVQPTGERSNVLKMKPPMCLTEADAEYFVARLEQVLETGW